MRRSEGCEFLVVGETLNHCQTIDLGQLLKCKLCLGLNLDRSMHHILESNLKRTLSQIENPILRRNRDIFNDKVIPSYSSTRVLCPID